MTSGDTQTLKCYRQSGESAEYLVPSPKTVWAMGPIFGPMGTNNVVRGAARRG